MNRALSCQSEGALMAYANPVVSVCLLGPGSARDEPGCITTLAGLVSAFGAPGAIALFARGWLLLSPLIAPSWSHVSASPLGDQVPCDSVLLAFTTASPTAAAPRA